MSRKPLKLVSLASALAALSGASSLASLPGEAKITTSDNTAGALKARQVHERQPNVVISAGADLLGMIVTKGSDGTVLADHYSHYSHSSHSSHASHYSST